VYKRLTCGLLFHWRTHYHFYWTQQQNFKTILSFLSTIRIKLPHIGLITSACPHVSSVWTKIHEIWYWSDLRANSNSGSPAHSFCWLAAGSILCPVPAVLLDRILCDSLKQLTHILTLITYSKFGLRSFRNKALLKPRRKLYENTNDPNLSPLRYVRPRCIRVFNNIT
jgi:hypothetical protein